MKLIILLSSFSKEKEDLCLNRKHAKSRYHKSYQRIFRPDQIFNPDILLDSTLVKEYILELRQKKLHIKFYDTCIDLIFESIN